MKTLLRLLGRCALALVALALALACTGAVYQVIGTWRDARRFPQRGKSIQAGQMKLNLDCDGEGSPSVILEGGLGGLGAPALGWSKVQPEIAKFAHVCSYDRAGYGWSEPGPEPRTSLQIAGELRALLDAAGERGPFVMVGHSFGGFNIRVFTGQYPNEVVGMVLVDASHEDQEQRLDSRLPPEVAEQEKYGEKLELTLAPYLIRFGVARSVARLRRPPDSLPRDLLQELNYLGSQTKSVNAVASEAKLFSQSAAQVRAAGKLGNLPLIVLTAGKPQDDPLLTKEQLDQQQDIWVHQLQSELAGLSTRGKQIVVADSDHLIPFERPDAVVSAVHEAWSESR